MLRILRARRPYLLFIPRRNWFIPESVVDSPSTTIDTDTVTDEKYASQTILNKNYAYELDYDHSPQISRDVDYDYEPINKNFKSYKTKIAPSFKAKASLTYSPQANDNLTYQPELHSVFKPQFIFVSNEQTIKDYYDYIIQLLSLLR
jgi:hypothetical protein